MKSTRLLRRDFLKVAGVSALLPASMMMSTRSRAQTSPSYDFFIAPNGLDSNPGTRELPWAITALNTKRATYAGKRVGLLDGVYNLYDLAYPSIHYSTAFLNIAGGIDSSRPTVIEAVNPRLAILDGSSNGRFLNSGDGAGGGLIGAVGSDRSYITLRNLVVRNHFGTAVMFARATGDGHTVAAKISGILVDGCEIHNTNSVTDGIAKGNNSGALVFFHVAGSTVRNCYIHHTYGETWTQVTHNSGILWWDVHDSVVEYCTFKMGPNPLHLKGAANARSTVRYNYMESDPARRDVCIRSDEGQSGGSTQIHNNVFKSISAISFSVNPFKTAETHIFNNTFVETIQSGIAHHQSSNASKWLRFYNNILYRTPSSIPGGDLEVSADTWAVLNNNCYSPGGFKGRAYTPNNTASSACVEFTTLAAWRTRAQASLSGAESASLQADPMFVGTGADADAYKLKAASPCRSVAIGGGEAGAWGNGTARIGAAVAPMMPMPSPPSTLNVT